MGEWIEACVIAAAVANLAVLGAARLSVCIRAVALQGVALGLFTVFAHAEDFSAHIACLAVMSILLKGGVFPRLLLRLMEQTNVRREMEPFVGYSASILVGIAMLVAALWISSRLPTHEVGPAVPVALPVALWTIFVGLFIIVARRKAISQVLGYIVLENGIFVFGVALAGGMPFLVEMGGLLDVFVAVFVMGIAIFHINREFEHIDTDRMAELKD